MFGNIYILTEEGESMGLFQSDLIYFEIHSDFVKATNIDTNASATSTDMAPFRHPRSPIADFLGAEKCLAELYKRVKRFQILRPYFIVHYLPQLEGGLSALEGRALKELVGRLYGRECFKLCCDDTSQPEDWTFVDIQIRHPDS